MKGVGVVIVSLVFVLVSIVFSNALPSSVPSDYYISEGHPFNYLSDADLTFKSGENIVSPTPVNPVEPVGEVLVDSDVEGFFVAFGINGNGKDVAYAE
ncbi:hypothetical protein HN604_02020 [archaeon]|jgi:hypothetical protein|nr:hypothetical protein [archaeon]MBT6182675.1 hypothetical protein [archaeon]MBT6606463.1 hypothetical protein [archaeon]MBT7251372.1 hypothetical protein [archaeon]MBT7660839.1 hypothetical protein [archaeon]